jgi:hypothetical protein
MNTARIANPGLFFIISSGLVMISLMFGVQAAKAAEWSVVAQSKDEIVYVDRSSIRADGDVRTARVLRSFSSVQTIGDDAFPHKSEILDYAVRCEDRSLGFEAWTMTAGEIGSGSTVWIGQVDKPALYQDPTDPAAAGIIDSTCNT